MPSFRPSPPARILLLVSLGLALAPVTLAAPSPVASACRPCGHWQLDAAASDDAHAAVEAALAKYKPRKQSRPRFTAGDIASESDAEMQFSLQRRPGEMRDELRKELERVATQSPDLRMRIDGDDVVIEGSDGRRRVTPGESHSRVDALGTAEIDSRWRKDVLTVSETYTRKTRNEDRYAVQPDGTLLVTRVIERRGLPTLTLRSRYRPASG